MRTTIILILLAAFLIPARAAVRPHLLVETNGALVAPSAFFTANQSAITALSSGVYQPLDSDLTAFAGISGVSGDIIYHNGSTWVRLPKGTDGQSLQLSSGFPTWATVVGGGGVGDVTLAGTNAFTGPNSFAGVTTLDGSVYINGATTISNQLTFKATGGSGDARLKWTGNKMLLANDTEISSLRTAGSDVAFGTFFAGPVQSYAVRADGMISWSDGTNAASAVFGPRRIEDRMNGVVRLSGGLGITERSAPPTPENNTGTIWLESATTKSIKVSWPDGTSSAIGSGGGGDVTLAGTNAFTGPNSFVGITALNGGWTPFTNSTRVVFEGDSLSLMTTPESQVGWPSYFTNRMSGLNLTYGTNAATTGQQVSTMQTDYATQIAPWAPSGGTNAILFFWGGVNDLYYSNSWSVAFQRITNYWQTAKASGYQLVGFEVTDSTNLTANARSQLPLLNDALRRHARTYCDWFINTAELFHDALDTNWVTAGVHYTSQANRLLADYVRWNLLQSGDYHANAFGAKAAPANYFRSLQFVSNNVPQTMQGGMMSWDGDAWATGRGALVSHDGTTNTVVVATVATDTPANGESPVWNTGGTIDWRGPFASLASPALTGDPTAPTASPGDNDTSLATTAFVENVRTNLDAGNVTSGTLASNRLPAAIALTTLSAGTLTATSVAGDGSGLTNLNGSNISSGTVAAARIDSAIARTNAPTLHSPTLLTPTLASPTLNGTATFEQTVLSAHSSVTNFVADPTVSPYQTINADLTTPFATVGFLHATNVAAGRQTTILVFAGTNASVTVSLAAQFARNTNSVALTAGQILPISFYGYGSSPTNVIATMGTVYTR